ncbi:MAG: diphthine--ammonia ligase [Planctomycetaceae bacterium]
MKRIALSWSGGKDSAFALWCLLREPDIEVAALVCTVTRNHDRIAMHGVRRSLLDSQVAAVGIPCHTVVIEQGAGNAAYEAATRDLYHGLKADGVSHIAFGDLYLADIRAYRERLVESTALSCLFPLWLKSTTQLAREFIAAGFQARLCCVDTTRVPAEFCGRAYDDSLLTDLPPQVDPCGENGEFHTFVWDGPIFRSPVPVSVGSAHHDRTLTFRDLLPAASAVQEVLT